MRKQITQDRMENALEYLQDTDDECAALKSDVARTEWKAKRKKAMVFSLATGSVADRNAESETHADVDKAWEEHFQAIEVHETMRNKRSTETLVFEAWRSLNSNRRQGGP